LGQLAWDRRRRRGQIAKTDEWGASKNAALILRRVWGSGFRVEGSGIGGAGLGFRVEG